MHRRCLPLLVLTLFSAAFLFGEDPSPPPKVSVFVPPLEVNGGSSALAEALRSRVRSLLLAKGFSVELDTPAKGGRFRINGKLRTEGDHLLVDLQVHDLVLRTLAITDMSAVFNGLTSSALLDQFLEDLISRLAEYQTAVPTLASAVPPVEGPLTFTGSQAGVAVYWRGHELVGHVVDGSLTAPYFPFPEDGRLNLTLEAEGLDTLETVVTLVPGTLSYALPRLQAPRLQEVVWSVGTGRLLGLGAEYRSFFAPGWAFWGAGAYPWVQARPDLKPVHLVEHLDLGGAAGVYLFFPPENWFRFALLARLDLMNVFPLQAQSPQWYLDASLTPIDVVFEYQFWGWTFQNEVKVPFALGITPNNLLGQRWLLINGSIPQVSFSWVQQW